MQMFQVDAFTDRLFAGNPAAVLILDDWLPDQLMQSIASENNLAETAFACPNPSASEPGKNSSWDLRWFTPTHEVNFCGHATLATAHILATEHGIQSDMLFETRVGTLHVRQSADGYQLDVPAFQPEQLDSFPAEISEIFGATPARPFKNFENIFAELPSEHAVRNFIPDLHAITQLGITGLVITAPGAEDGAEHDFVSRYFVPGAGIPEDPVTGSTHATLVPYWAEKLGKTQLRAFQASVRGGLLVCDLAGDRVLISGHAVTFMEARIRVSK
ncbi:PhzF family phenazine biosynthesis protein [Pararhizobium sp. IMCC21322]|uniref:PhzF family phenazine biosynthesis protein n=1 Tax=Pararhizobium sp. IMCC21322 TaxID=3067903 RepID=UPI0027421BE5|nr:PhzF family phenazine biosynthesis protein [Pararhizobium sp. IMCC21322]